MTAKEKTKLTKEFRRALTSAEELKRQASREGWGDPSIARSYNYFCGVADGLHWALYGVPHWD